MISKVIIDDEILSIGSKITQDSEDNVSASMKNYMDKIEPVSNDRLRRKQQNSMPMQSEETSNKRILGALVWIGNGARPQVALSRSLEQQKIAKGSLVVICIANKIQTELKSLDPTIC